MKDFEAKKIDKLLGDEFVQGYLFDEGQNIIAPRKATKAEMGLRIKTIRRLLIAGYSRQAIIEYCELRFCLASKSVYKYFDIINEEFREESKKDRETNYGLAISRMEQALLSCELDNDMNNRVRILQELNKLQGLIVNKIQGSGEDGELVIKFVNKTKEQIEGEEKGSGDE